VRCSRGVFILLAALSLIGCQAIPSGPRNPALAPLPDAAGLTVRPVTGLPSPQAAAVALAMADALGARNIPAATRGANVKSRFVAGDARIEEAPPGALRVRIGWRLVTRDGTVLGTHRAEATVPRALWDNPEGKGFRSLADGAATEFAALIQAPEIPTAPPPPARLRLHVWPIEGAPGGGNEILRREMQGALRRRGHVVSDLVEQDMLVVSGWVDVGPLQSGSRALSVSWAVLDWRGRELGTLAQSKRVPAGDIEAGWHGFAALIAESAADGVDEVLRKSRDRKIVQGLSAFTGREGAGKVRAPRHSPAASLR